MDCNNPCSNSQSPVHRIKHFLCNKPDCAICSTAHGPILCDETHVGDGQIYFLTQKERNIAAIVKFFHDNCLQYFMSLNNVDQYAEDLTQFSSELLIALLNYIKKCSAGWTLSIHMLSRTFPTIEQDFKATAQEYNIQEAYTQFLIDHHLDSFIV